MAGSVSKGPDKTSGPYINKNSILWLVNCNAVVAARLIWVIAMYDVCHCEGHTAVVTFDIVLGDTTTVAGGHTRIAAVDAAAPATKDLGT